MALGIKPGNALIGNVGQSAVVKTVIPTLAGTAYGTNFVVGGVLTFRDMLTTRKTGMLQSVVVSCKKVETTAWTFVLFSSYPNQANVASVLADNAAAAIGATDVPLVREAIALTNYSGLGTHTTMSAFGLGLPVDSSDQNLYGILICSATMTNNLAAGDISVTIKVLQDA